MKNIGWAALIIACMHYEWHWFFAFCWIGFLLSDDGVKVLKKWFD